MRFYLYYNISSTAGEVQKAASKMSGDFLEFGER